MTHSLSIEQLESELEANRCIAIVGPGVPTYCTDNAEVASYIGLLHHGVRYCTANVRDLPDTWASSVIAEINSGDLDRMSAAAQDLARRLGGPHSPEHERWLRESVGALKSQRPELLEALKQLGIALLTTNYDTVLEQVSGLEAVAWMNDGRVERVLRGDERAVVHLCGHWKRPESVIVVWWSIDHF